MNRLYFGGNLGWLRNTKEFPDASVDLVYLDPPDVSECTLAADASSSQRITILSFYRDHFRG